MRTILGSAGVSLTLGFFLLSSPAVSATGAGADTQVPRPSGSDQQVLAHQVGGLQLELEGVATAVQSDLRDPQALEAVRQAARDLRQRLATVKDLVDAESAADPAEARSEPLLQLRADLRLLDDRLHELTLTAPRALRADLSPRTDACSYREATSPAATGAIAGTVTDGASVPLSGVAVDVYDCRGSWLTYAVTNGTGAYTTPAVLGTGAHYVVASGPGYIPEVYDNVPCSGCLPAQVGTPIQVTDGATTSGINFALAAGGTLTGTVSDAGTAAPLAGVWVWVYSSSGVFATSASTNASGVYLVSGLATGTYYAKTNAGSASGYLNELYDDFPCASSATCPSVTTGTPISVTAGGTTAGVNFGLAAGGRISGTVTNASGGAPLSGASVSIYDATARFMVSATTNASGVYTTGGLPTGTYYARTTNNAGFLNEIYNDVPCYTSSTCPAVTTGTPISVTAGATTPAIDFGLVMGGTLSGTVTDATTAAPLSGVTVSIYNSTGGFVVSRSTNASGVYSASGLPTGTYYATTANPSGYVNEMYNDIPCPGACIPTLGTPISVTAGATTSGIDFGLGAGGRISGRVTDAGTGLGLGGVTVRIWSAVRVVDTVTTDCSGAYISGAGLSTGSYYATTTNSLGYMDEAYDNVPCPNCNPGLVGTPIAVTLGATTANIDLALDHGGRISGSVTSSATAAGLANVGVDIYSSTGAYQTSGYTSASGLYTTGGGLPSGTYYARTWNSQGYIDELYNDISCPAGSCSVTGGTPITVTVPLTTTGINFALAAGGRISGTVTDVGTGLPLAGVAVQVFNAAGTWLTSVNTNSSGVYTTSAGLPSGTYYTRTFNSLGYIDELYNDISCPVGSCTVTGGTPIAVTAPSTTTGINFALALGGRISGTVTDVSTSLPLGGVPVRVYNALGSSMGTATTNASGVYTASMGLPAGTYYARTFNTLGYVDELYDNIPCPCTVTGGAPIAVTAGVTTTGIDFALAVGGRVSGTVTDAATTLPLSGVSVRIHNSAGTVAATATTNASGVYTTSVGLSSGTYYVRTSNALGYVDELYDNIACPCTVTNGAPIAVTAGATTTGIDFALGRGGRISGTVTDASSGTPLVDVEVDIYGVDGTVFGVAFTDGAGTYLPPAGLPAGTYYAVTSNALGYLDELYNNVSCPGGLCIPTRGTPISVTVGVTTSGIDFALAAGGRISGVVTDAVSGLPLQNVPLSVYDSYGALVTLGFTDSTGMYTSGGGLLAGSYYVTTLNSLGYIDELYNNVTCPGFGCTLTSGTTAPVTLGATTAGIDFALAPGGRVSGTVTNVLSGAPLAGVTVDIHNASGTLVVTGLSDSLGNFVTRRGLPTGTYYAKTRNAQGYADELYDNLPCSGYGCTTTTGTPISVTAGATTGGINFGLGAGGLINGRITDASSGLPLAAVRVHVLNAAGDQLTSVLSGSDGRYVVGAGLPTGSYYLLTTNATGYQDELSGDLPCPSYLMMKEGLGLSGRRVPVPSCTLSSGATVAVTTGSTTTFDFGLALGGRAAGFVTGAGAAAIPGVRVDVFGSSGQWLGGGETDGTGFYQTPAQPAGSYYLRTTSTSAWVDELFDNIPCPGGSCTVTSGTPVGVTVGATTSGISFELRPDLVFKDGFD